MWFQKTVTLSPKARGFHLVTREITAQVPELGRFRVGLAHLFTQHTSASLTINENCDPDVRADMGAHFNEFVPENAAYYRHLLEGSDDMPAHLKATTIGCISAFPSPTAGLFWGPGRGFIWANIGTCRIPGSWWLPCTGSSRVRFWG